MKDNLQFRVSAELKNILGRDLITSPNIAILELVKNSYDARAQKVEITFDDDYLSIADNGKGMSKQDLLDKWLFVAYSAKSDGTEDISYRDKFTRRYAGAKGIGRLSCDRLANNLILTTRSNEGNKTEVLYVDWTTFENNKKTEFDTIDIPHESLDSIATFPQNYSTGTILEFSNLHDKWSREDILRLRKSLEKMINPFSGTDDNFQIEIIAPKMKEEDEKSESGHDVVNGIIENSIADVLKLKTTQIESRIENGLIHTTLTDRGVLMYEIEEHNDKYPKLESASVSLFYLNRAAKYNFTAKMGVEPIKYGNVFLFRNGFRIFPFGEFDDDSWGINKRLQQGYNRSLATRELFGRVDVETDNPELIKEVSSRDGGLIKTEASQQLMSYFTRIHRRLERYVVGVLWGEGFLRKEYFVNQASAIDARKQLEGDKDSDSAEHLYSSIGSKVDFMQLVRSLVNDNSITVKYYNEELANIVSNPTETEVLQAQMFEDVRKMAEKTNDDALLEKIADFERHMDELRRQKEEAERKAKEEEKKAEEARKKAEEEEKKRIEEERKRKETEHQLEQKTKQVLFLQSVDSLDKDMIVRCHHDIKLNSETINNFIEKLVKETRKHNCDFQKINEYLGKISEVNGTILSIAMFATKANFNFEGDFIQADLVEYINQYVSNILPDYYNEISFHCDTNDCKKDMRFRPLEVNMILYNMLTNSIKANADSFSVCFNKTNESKIEMLVFDNGDGLSEDIKDPNSIFDKGVTTTYGSGLGLYSVRHFVEKELNGKIIVANNLQSDHNSSEKGLRIKIMF